MLQNFTHSKKYLSEAAQVLLIEEIVKIVSEAPFFIPTMPRWGKPFSVRMSNCGPLGWVSDKEKGYRYQSTHPDTGKTWPPIPDQLLELWFRLTNYPHPPEACLINAYSAKAKMGLHQDRDEKDFDAPVLSISLGDTAVFRLGGKDRKDPTTSMRLESGDIVLLAGDSRLAFHGVDRIESDTSTLLNDCFPGYNRLNLTLRRVSIPE